MRLDRMLLTVVLLSALVLIGSASAALAQRGFMDILWWVWR